MTLKLYRKSDNKKKGIIRKILVDGMWTGARLAHLPNPPCTEEGPCGLGRETLKHLWWDLPSMDHMQRKNRGERGADHEDLTIAVPEGPGPMVAIFIARYSSFGQ